ncbi:MAG: hypothetical protein JSR87_10790 [Proteobacteria bacterium]|nr:hypothetical protein [Pseudomonadota bacterium]MBS0574422.1 hypothetical protein [Pseudomonadota bacterium]
MAFRITDSFVGAVLGAAITSLVGPAISDWYKDRFVRDSNWEGDWKAIACTPNSSSNWNINFTQKRNLVSGMFASVDGNTSNGLGLFLGEVKGRVFSGTWAQLSNRTPHGGPFIFGLGSDGQSFFGNYTDESNKIQSVWLGSQGERPTCGQ